MFTLNFFRRWMRKHETISTKPQISPRNAFVIWTSRFFPKPIICHFYIAQNIDTVLCISSQMLNIYIVLCILFYIQCYQAFCIRLRSATSQSITVSFRFIFFANPIGKYSDHSSLYAKTVAILKIEGLIWGHVVLVLLW